MGDQKKLHFEYSGLANLDAMSHARNYNRFLLGVIRRNLIGDRILDFGAGAGTFAVPLSNENIDITCVEPDSGMRAKLSDGGLDTFASIDEVPVNSFDTLYTLNVLEHIADDRAALAAVYERLRVGGRAIIYVPAFSVLYTAMDKLVGHHRRYRRNDLVGKLRTTGFRIESARYVDSLGFFATLLYRWIGDNSGVMHLGSVKLYDRFLFPLSRVFDRLVLGAFGKNLLVVCTR